MIQNPNTLWKNGGHRNLLHPLPGSLTPREAWRVLAGSLGAACARACVRATVRATVRASVRAFVRQHAQEA
jgi:hypothetical protein